MKSTTLASGKARKAFTLAEMLVAVSVVALLLVLFLQITHSATATVSGTQKRIDADRAARLVLDRLAVDIGRMIKRDDIDYSFNKVSGNDSLAFFSETAGFYELTTEAPKYSRRRASSALVGYQAQPTSGTPTNIELRRLSRGLVWADDQSDTAMYNTVVFLPVRIIGTPGMYGNVAQLYNPDSADFKVISNQVFRLEYCFLLQDGNLSVDPWIVAPPSGDPTPIKDVTAVVVAIAVLDNVSRVIVNDIRGLRDALPDATSGADIAGRWNNVINGKDPASPFPPTSVPRLAASAVRVYQRYCYLGQD